MEFEFDGYPIRLKQPSGSYRDSPVIGYLERGKAFLIPDYRHYGEWVIDRIIFYREDDWRRGDNQLLDNEVTIEGDVLDDCRDWIMQNTYYQDKIEELAARYNRDASAREGDRQNDNRVAAELEG